MRSRVTQTLPSWMYIGIFFLILGAVEVYRVLIATAEGPDPLFARGFYGYQIVVGSGAAFFGFWRATMFSPISNVSYGAWLRTTPWLPGKPMPMGPWHLGIPDVLPIGVLCVLAAYGGWDRVWIPMMAVATAFTVGISFHQLHYGWNVLACVAGYLIIAVSLVTRHEILVVVLPVLMWMYSTYSVRESLRQYAADNGGGKNFELFAQMFNPYADHSPPQDINDAVYSRMARSDNSLATSVFGSGLLAFFWFCTLYVLVPSTGNAYEDEAMAPILTFAFSFLVICIAAIRWFGYRIWVKRPISIMGRIWLGMFIIPKFDVILLPPAAIGAVGFAAAWVALRIQWPPTLWQPVVLMLCLLIAAKAPPSFMTWRLTGAHTTSNSYGRQQWVEGL